MPFLVFEAASLLPATLHLPLSLSSLPSLLHPLLFVTAFSVCSLFPSSSSSRLSVSFRRFSLCPSVAAFDLFFSPSRFVEVAFSLGLDVVHPHPMPLPKIPSAARLAELLSGGGGLPILSERVVYRGWRNVIKRQVQFPNGQPVTFDVTDAPPAVLVLPWCSKTKTMTLLKEYCPGVNERGMYTLVAGLYEEKHASVEDCVRCETEEEAHLRGGTLIPVMDSPDRSLPGAKYTGQKFLPYIVKDAQKVSDPRPLDEDEIILPVHEITPDEAVWLALHGRITSTGCMMLFMALHKLKELREL
ncbi:hydrolase, NUDIX family protein [Toxoplasma gondii VAND]|uniref:Hydrolase, NUDIX family protein n=1 Tax=Toxoplasma gondii VAND TaxID=933077 RepID=A0A086PHZ5_TOXGO|nr:hydrolase, NUDIX family protein [Toxoplasma gondii VAND]